MVSLAIPVTLRPSGRTPVSNALLTLKKQVKQEASTTVPAKPKPALPTYPIAPADAVAGIMQRAIPSVTAAIENFSPFISPPGGVPLVSAGAASGTAVLKSEFLIY